MSNSKGVRCFPVVQMRQTGDKVFVASLDITTWPSGTIPTRTKNLARKRILKRSLRRMTFSVTVSGAVFLDLLSCT